MASIITNPRERTRFLKFAVVGVIGFIVDLGTSNLLILAFSASTNLAQTVSFFAAIISNFTWNRYWTYPDSRSKRLLDQLLKFTIVNAIGYLIRSIVINSLEPIFTRMFTPMHPPLIPPHALGFDLSLVIAVIIVLFWNFFVNRYITYNDVE
jgi:putative flippase GtrA